MNATRSKIAASTSTVSVAFLGDSSVDSNIMHTAVQSSLEAVHGTNGGSGWHDVKPFNRTGAWTDVDEQTSSFGLDMSHFATNDTSAEFTISGNGENAVLHYICQPGGGSFEYKYAGGAWLGPISTDGPAALKTLLVAGGSATGNSIFKVRVDTIGSGLMFTGVDYQTLGGVRVHELGNGGLDSRELVTFILNDPVMKSHWQDSLVALNPCLLVVNLGNNDQGSSISPAQYAANMQQISDCAKQALPNIDVMLVSNFDTNRSNPAYGMNEYADALDALDSGADCSFCVVNGYNTLGPYNSNASGLWDNDTHLTDAGDQQFVAPIIDKLV
jgi:hypothetical protein